MRGCLIGLTKLSQGPVRRKWLTLTAHVVQVFEIRNKRRNYQLKIIFFTDLPLILFITLSRNFGVSVTVFKFVPFFLPLCQPNTLVPNCSYRCLHEHFLGFSTVCT